MFWVCICNLWYPAYNAHSYDYLWPFRMYNFFPHFLVNGTIPEKSKLLDIKCVFWFYVQILSETFLILRRNDRGNDLKTTCYSCPILMILIFFREILGKWFYIKFHTNPFSGSRAVLRVRTDGRTDMTKVIVVFRNLAKALTKEDLWLM